MLLAACLMGVALPAWPDALRCDAATCPPLQLQLEQGFEVSRQRLAQGSQAAAPAPMQMQPASRPVPEATPASLSPWLIGAIALAGGMLLQGFMQGLLRRRRMAATAAVVETAIAEAPIPVRALGLEADAVEVTPAVMSIIEPPLAEARLSPVEEEPQATPARFELESLDVETPSPVAVVAGSQLADAAGEAPPEPEGEEIAPAALAEPVHLELTGEAWITAEDPMGLELEPQFLAATREERPSSDDPVPFELEPLNAEAPTLAAGVADTVPDEMPPELEIVALEPAASPEPDVPEQSVLALEPRFLALDSDAMPQAEALADALDAVIAAGAEEITALDLAEDVAPAQAAPVEAAAGPVGGSEPSRSAAADAHHLETVALLRRLSAQRARGLHPEERLASVFRRISSGRTDAADRSLRELEAFCSEDEEAFPPELMTTRQHIVRGRDHELGQRIEALRALAQDESSVRRLAVAGAFLRRSRFDAVTGVLDELEADLGKEIEIL